MFTPEQNAYVAGMLDADGWISIQPTNAKRNARRGGKRQSFTHHVGIVNKHLETLQWICDEFGGFISAKKWSGRYKNWSPCFDWVNTSQSVVPFLKAMLPYLRIKKAQAELVIQFMETVNSKPSKYGRVPAEIYMTRINLYAKAKELNQTGVIPINAEFKKGMVG